MCAKMDLEKKQHQGIRQGRKYLVRNIKSFKPYLYIIQNWDI